MNVAIGAMNPNDLDAGLRLSTENGWNQLRANWQRQFDLDPDCCFAARAEGRVIGTACACRFGQVAWVNLVLVDEAWRGRGIGTRLMRTVLDALDAMGVVSVRLDATPLGQPIYEKLGFAVEYTLTRFGGVLANPQDSAGAETARPDDLPAIAALDLQVTSTDRRRLLDHLWRSETEPLCLVRGRTGIVAYAGCRPGARAWQIGPCLGEPTGCQTLLDALSRRLAGEPVIIDVPAGHREACAWASALGLSPQRTLTRMGRGPRIHEQLDRLWASFGPEKG